MEPPHLARPLATASIEPRGPRTTIPRDHLIQVTLKLSQLDPKHPGKVELVGVMRKIFDMFAPLDGGEDRRKVGELLQPTKAGAVVVGVEGSVIWLGRPDENRVASLRAVIVGEGYNVTVRELRECTHAGCLKSATVAWNALSEVPSRWFSQVICGQHDYKSCSHCASIYRMTSSNAAGQAPSVKCEVCGLMMVEWGGTKIWDAELVTNGVSVNSS